MGCARPAVEYSSLFEIEGELKCWFLFEDDGATVKIVIQCYSTASVCPEAVRNDVQTAKVYYQRSVIPKGNDSCLEQLMLNVRRQISSCAAMTIPHKAGESGEPMGEPKHWRKFLVGT